jgi:hypothetical protein
VADPCVKCGATIFAGAESCSSCNTPVHRATVEERARARRGPKLAAALTLMLLGVAVIAFGLLMGGGRRYVYGSRSTIYFFGFGAACIAAGAATYRDL